MRTTNNILAHPTLVNNTQTNTIELAVADGPHYNPDFREYEVWLDGEVIAYARTQVDAYRIYHGQVTLDFESRASR